MPRGDRVIIKASRDQPAVRRVWEEGEAEVQVVYEDYYRRWEREKVDPLPFAIPRERVFQYEEGLARQLEEAFQKVIAGEPGARESLEALWTRARPYRPQGQPTGTLG